MADIERLGVRKDEGIVLAVTSLLRNGHDGPDGRRVTGVRLLTTKGVIEMWSDQEGNAEAVEAHTRTFIDLREFHLTGK